MGKHHMVIEIGAGNTKISAFRKEKDVFELFGGAIFHTLEAGLKDEELFSNISQFIKRAGTKKADLKILLPEDGNDVILDEITLPLGSKKELDGMVKSSLPGLLKDDESLFYHSWRLRRTYAGEQGDIQVAAVRKEYMDMLHEIAEQNKLQLVCTDIITNAVECLGNLLCSNSKYAPSAPSEAIAVVDVGHKNARITVAEKNGTLCSAVVSHNLYRMDKLIRDAAYDRNEDNKIHPELLKMNPSYALRVSQYEDFLSQLSSDIIRNIKQAIGRDGRGTLSAIYFTGGMYKTPKLVSSVKDSFNVPCYAFPIRDYMTMADRCIHCQNGQIYPNEDVFAASFGALTGGLA